MTAAWATGPLVSAHAADFVWRAGGAIAVEQKKDTLITLVLEFTHDGFAVADARLPVDVANRFTTPVLR